MMQREFQLEVWALIIQKSTVIPPSLMVLFLKWYYNYLGRPSLFQCLQKRPVLFLQCKKRFCEQKKSDQDAKTAFQSHTCERGLAQKQFGFHWVCWPTLRRLLHTKKVISRYKMDNEVDEKAFKELAAFVIEAIVIPVLAVFGIAGNLLLVDWDPIRHVGTFCFLPWSSQRSTKPSKIRVSQFV